MRNYVRLYYTTVFASNVSYTVVGNSTDFGRYQALVAARHQGGVIQTVQTLWLPLDSEIVGRVFMLYAGACGVPFTNVRPMFLDASPRHYSSRYLRQIRDDASQTMDNYIVDVSIPSGG